MFGYVIHAASIHTGIAQTSDRQFQCLLISLVLNRTDQSSITFMPHVVLSIAKFRHHWQLMLVERASCKYIFIGQKFRSTTAFGSCAKNFAGCHVQLHSECLVIERTILACSSCLRGNRIGSYASISSASPVYLIRQRPVTYAICIFIRTSTHSPCILYIASDRALLVAAERIRIKFSSSQSRLLHLPLHFKCLQCRVFRVFSSVSPLSKL
jgi:hypothetical protein